MIKKNMAVLFILLLISSTAQGNMFDDIWNNIVPHKSSNTTIIQSVTKPENDFKGFMDMMYILNTPTNLQNLKEEMSDLRLNSVKVIVTKIPNCKGCQYTFYVVRNQGIVEKYNNFGRTDKIVVLSYNQLMKMYPYFQSEKIDFFDRWQLYAIYKVG